MAFDLQTIFNAGYLGVLKQGRPSATPDGSCYYRHPHDPAIRCALGHALTDDKYRPEFENVIPSLNHHAEPDQRDLARTLGAETAEDADTLREFQRCHDAATSTFETLEFVEAFKFNAAVFARDHNLTIPEPEA
jgi:hypothetical protein